MRSNSKAGYYFLEGINSLASAYFFGGLIFVLHRIHGLSDLSKLSVGAVHGLLWVGASWFAGRFGQRFGCFAALRLGFGGMLGGVVLAAFFPSLGGQLCALAVWTVATCFTWPSLEALVSERESTRALANRLGLYNVIWGGTAALGYFICAWMYERLGIYSLYWFPAALHLVQLAVLPKLRKLHDANQGQALEANPFSQGDGNHPETGSRRSPEFIRLAWLANSFAYMAINTLLVIAPSIADRAHLSASEASMWLSAWFFARAIAFGMLWKWHGWHYRFDWFVSAFLMILLGFAGLMLLSTPWHLVICQLLFGWGAGLIYYSSLYYAMDGSDSHVEHSGLHEAFLGAGIGAGPAVCAMTLWLAPQNPTGPAWTVSVLLVGAMGGLFWIRRRAAS